MKYILHIDLNAFFAQVEMNRHPELKGKPIAVGGGIRGVIATSSYEARKFGVVSGMAATEASKICPGLVLIPGDYYEYSRQSKLFFGEVKKVLPLIEMASIDECYADATEFVEGLDEPDIHDKLFDLQMDLLRKTNLKCSMGIGHTRFLAKMGSDYKKPLGITLFLEPKEWQSKLWPLPIAKMYGVGKKSAPKLEAIGIKSIGDLANLFSPGAKKTLGAYYDDLVGEANGYGSDAVAINRNPNKSISNDITLNSDATDYEELKNYLLICAKAVAGDLKKRHLVTKTVCVKLRNNEFQTQTKREAIDTYTSQEVAISYQAMKIFDGFYKGQPIRLIGCAAEDCLPEGKIKKKETQMTLFDVEKDNEDQYK